MTSYTPPVPEDLNWHPVYRANALLREALQSTTQSLEFARDALQRRAAFECDRERTARTGADYLPEAARRAP